MSPRIWDVLIALVAGGGFEQALGLALKAARQMRRDLADRETPVARARREADEWELVARRARVIAVSLGAPLESLPAGPGEEMSPSGPRRATHVHDDD